MPFSADSKRGRRYEEEGDREKTEGDDIQETKGRRRKNKKEIMLRGSHYQTQGELMELTQILYLFFQFIIVCTLIRRKIVLIRYM